MTVVELSGISSTRTICAAVPMVYSSAPPGSSVWASICVHTPITALFSCASRISLSDLGRATATGDSTPGNITMLRKGRMGNVSPASS